MNEFYSVMEVFSMSIELVVGVLAVIVIAMLVYKMVKAALVFGLVAAVLYYGYPLAEQYILPLAGSFH